MRIRLVHPRDPFPLVRILSIVVLTLLLSGWTTCTAIIGFSSCQGVTPIPRIAALSPESIPGDTESVLLMVNGSDFVPQSEILWNGSALQTSFQDSSHLGTTITKQMLDSIGGSPGSTAQISVRSPGSGRVFGCPNGGDSGVLVLVID